MPVSTPRAAAFSTQEEVVERFEYAESFPFIHRATTRFPRELATIGHIQTVITTNWDTSFEDFCHARPFVVDEDYAYYDLPGRPFTATRRHELPQRPTPRELGAMV